MAIASAWRCSRWVFVCYSIIFLVLAKLQEIITRLSSITVAVFQRSDYMLLVVRVFNSQSAWLSQQSPIGTYIISNGLKVGTSICNTHRWITPSSLSDNFRELQMYNMPVTLPKSCGVITHCGSHKAPLRAIHLLSTRLERKSVMQTDKFTAVMRWRFDRFHGSSQHQAYDSKIPHSSFMTYHHKHEVYM